ncbi:MAG: cob(I)yrinic acid a,c-diamide adenosyltransferase [Candidatus Symbiothrix sp.]|jgi:cob(I)alamin adenosyltransferase|nr:cob(I)yrinic acid a,c-diamide adenosyltransferase [Candidatus Symbiothrix sp.]
MKIYTRTGDRGKTSLVGGKRVSKTDARIEAYGTVDELNAFIACLLDEINDPDDRKFLLQVQHDLFTLGAYLATEQPPYPPQGGTFSPLRRAGGLETEIDKIAELIPPSNKFSLPGGCKSNSLAHVCRTICRRAERRIYALSEQVSIDPAALKYINRLSDYFFLLARKQSFLCNQDEIFWENPCK